MLFIRIMILVGLSACHNEPQTIPVIKKPINETKLQTREKLSLVNVKECTASPDGKLIRAECAEGSLCVAHPLKFGKGECMVECGQNVSGKLTKDQSKCQNGLTCMAYNNGGVATVGMFCLKKSMGENLPCSGPNDPDACTDGLRCLPTVRVNLGALVLVGRTECKRECSIDSDCPQNQGCLLPAFARTERQPGGPYGQSCSVRLCEKGELDCDCNKSAGFECKRLIEKSDFGLCERVIGVCGEKIPLASRADFRGRDFFGATCNEIEDNRFCENIGVSRPTCKILGKKSYEGACVLTCREPALDMDGDGVIGENENGSSSPCPANYSCQTHMARRFPFYKYIMRAKAQVKCNPNACEAGKPCPTECGPGDAECIQKPGTSDGICGAPIGLCEHN